MRPEASPPPAPLLRDPAEVSVVVPVKDNQSGVDRLLERFTHRLRGNDAPREILVVDNGSRPPVTLETAAGGRPAIRLLSCARPGPAAARNAGARQAEGAWLLFTDSDCTPTRGLLAGYLAAQDGAVGYSGHIEVVGSGLVASYYRSQESFASPVYATGRPEYLLTGNGLILASAFRRIGGFDERFTLAGGEDTDLSYRLRGTGRLAWARGARVRHHVDGGLRDFAGRHLRYGRANALLEALHGGSYASRFFRPKEVTLSNLLLAGLQVVFTRLGYRAGKRELSALRSAPPTPGSGPRGCDGRAPRVSPASGDAGRPRRRG